MFQNIFVIEKALHLQGFVIILYNFLSPKLRWIMVSCHLCEPPCQPHSTTAFTSQAKYIFMSVQLKKSPSIYILNTKHFFVKRKQVNTKKNTPVSMHISYSILQILDYLIISQAFFFHIAFPVSGYMLCTCNYAFHFFPDVIPFFWNHIIKY